MSGHTGRRVARRPVTPKPSHLAVALELLPIPRMAETFELEHAAEDRTLCYLNAASIEAPVSSTPDRLEVRGSDGRKIGLLDGVIIDPEEHRLRYLVVARTQRFRRHRYLVPLAPTTLDAERHALRVDINPADLKN